MNYKKVLIKISGESLSGSLPRENFDEDLLENFCITLKEIQKQKIGAAIVVGGGNIFRGLKGIDKGFDRVYGDYMGMMATIINTLAFKSFLEKLNAKVEIFSAIRIGNVVREYNIQSAREFLKKGYIVILGGGLGCPYFTTDTAAAIRAIELKCEILIKATKVDGVYNCDPLKNKDAEKYDFLTYEEVINKKLQIMDLSSVILCMENKLNICVLNIFKKDSLKNFLSGKKIGTIIGGKKI